MERRLSKRELECCSLIVNGYSDKQIARIMGISYGTVRNHVDTARLKTGTENRAHLAAYIRGEGYA